MRIGTIVNLGFEPNVTPSVEASGLGLNVNIEMPSSKREREWNYDKERMFFDCIVLFFMDTNNLNLILKQNLKLQWFQLTRLPMLDGFVANIRASQKLFIEYPGKHEVGLQLTSS